MAKGAHAHMARALDGLLTTDPVGADRVEAAYNSVGLGFWPASVRSIWRLRARRRWFAAASLGCVVLVTAFRRLSTHHHPPTPQLADTWWPFSSESMAQAEAERQDEAAALGQELQLGLGSLGAVVLFVAVRFWREQLDILRSLVRL